MRNVRPAVRDLGCYSATRVISDRAWRGTLLPGDRTRGDRVRCRRFHGHTSDSRPPPSAGVNPRKGKLGKGYGTQVGRARAGRNRGGRRRERRAREDHAAATGRVDHRDRQAVALDDDARGLAELRGVDDPGVGRRPEREAERRRAARLEVADLLGQVLGHLDDVERGRLGQDREVLVGDLGGPVGVELAGLDERLGDEDAQRHEHVDRVAGLEEPADRAVVGDGHATRPARLRSSG